MLTKTFTKILVISFLIFSISNTAKGQYRQAHSIDLVLGGDFGYRLINFDASNPAAQVAYNNRDQRESYKNNYRFGLNYMHGLNNNFSIKAGVRYANPGFNIGRVDGLDPLEDINTIQKDFNGGDYYEYKYNYQLLEFPIGIRYLIAKSFCEPYFEVGLATNIYLKTVVQTSFLEEVVGNMSIDEDIKKVHYISFLSMGGNFIISDHLSGFTQLIARYQLNNLRQSELVEKLVGLGVEVGVRYYL